MAQSIATCTTKEQWETLFREANIPEGEAKQYFLKYFILIE